MMVSTIVLGMLRSLLAPEKLLVLALHFNVFRQVGTTFDWVSALDTNFERELFTGLKEVTISVAMMMRENHTLHPFTSTEQISDLIKGKLPKVIAHRVLVQVEVTVRGWRWR